MTEAEWRSTGDVLPLLRHVAATASDRKNRLYMCAVCRRATQPLYGAGSSHLLVELGERYADGDATADECWKAACRVCDPANAYAERFCPTERSGQRAILTSRLIALSSPDENADRQYANNIAWTCIWAPQPGAERYPLVHFFAYDRANRWLSRQGHARRLVVCVYGDPFRPVSPNAAWLTPTAVAIARVIYDNKTFHDLPVLADALEDAGCDAADLLAHCRDGGDHARGCWVLDAVLGLR